MDWDPSHNSPFVHICFIIWLDINLWLAIIYKSKIVVLTHFFITKHSVYYKWQIKELLALWYYVLYYLLTVPDNADDQSGLRLYWS